MRMYRKLLLAAVAGLSVGLAAPAFAGDRHERGHGYAHREHRHGADHGRFDRRHGWHGRHIERRPIVIHRHYYPVRPAPIYVEPGIEYRYPPTHRPHVVITVPPFVLDF